MNATFTDKDGKEKPFVMGCYGIGIGRCVAAAIEQGHDENGIVFPISIAPFEVIVLPVQMNEADVVKEAEKIYYKLSEAGIDVLIDDRDERAGVKFNDADLIGIPIRITVGKKALKEGKVELKLRSEKQTEMIPLESASELVVKKVKELYDSLK
jgi:prolyl-tRNA synthetase